MRVVASLVDGFVFAFFVIVMTLVRYDFHMERINVAGMFVCSGIALAVFLVGGPFSIYRGRYHRGSTDQFAAIAGTVALGVGFMWVAEFLFSSQLLIPTSVPIAAGAMILVAKSFENWARRNMKRRSLSSSRSSKATLVVGAGSQGMLALDMITQDDRGEYFAVGLLDDDPAKRHLRYNGIRVLGPISEIAHQVDRTGASVVVIAISDLPPQSLERIASDLESRPIEIKIMPSFAEFDYTRSEPESVEMADLRHRNFRDVSLEDLIGRKPISTNIEDISSTITGRVVLVTGAGGSIGSQLCRQVARFDPARIVMTDRDESGLHSTQLGLEGSAMLTNEDLVLGDLRDTAFINTLVADVKPDIIFHAAALKHLTFLERFPEQAVRTNIGASLDLLDAAVANDVEAFVHISTDKAAEATSVLGRTKFSIERAVASVAAESGRKYMSVRFGNVLGSRGSVLETFVAQVAAGDPVTVTDPEVTRYFMTADEACELVLQAAAIGRPGETLVLDMGEPIRIDDLAKRVIALSGRPDARIIYTGLRPGEKLTEALLSPGEIDDRPMHPLITQVPISPIDLSELRRVVRSSREPEVFTRRKELEAELACVVGLATAIEPHADDPAGSADTLGHASKRAEITQADADARDGEAAD
ncbi:NDP-sugar epimerase, includes UDP-GlcNAc-inverting 4,6-dehydratase FlaA1 and capsular polysaccharide biosynthesis protein EpsC [Brevibacterium aurantiacum]|uniref:NDP-sugar epimerase, includes UDP-GlcNAc-inverting 4,6-dehydratase FlaA1 and capsular polysaccharide biosynthesis protein EpsC n=2 Tax=Brevibacterium aurantiacum TaxID=273384 RepID=A0A2H1J2L7_BREAU|nr:NDP-sugar epimerase, includes UDP-GlcNAc-inverting 4,6-dehydratase FlaA1 and capsular polysaccharide biosynthesis protein EpsC [Brevibacterium aurantiacum]